MESERAKIEYVMSEIKEMENDESRPLKRKRVVLTLEDKMDVICKKEEGLPYADIAKLFNIGTTTVKDIIKNKDSIIRAVERDRQFGVTKKTLLVGRKPKVEERLYLYVNERIEKGEIVTNKQLIQEAKILTKQLYNEDWTPSPGWVGKFKNRYNIHTNMLKDITYDEEIQIPFEDETQEEIRTEINDQELNESFENDHIDEIEPFETEVEIEVPEEPEEPLPTLPHPPQIHSVGILNACDVLVDFMTEHNFPLKDIITVRVIKEKINQMPEARLTKYDLIENNEEEISSNES